MLECLPEKCLQRGIFSTLHQHLSISYITEVAAAKLQSATLQLKTAEFDMPQIKAIKEHQIIFFYQR